LVAAQSSNVLALCSRSVTDELRVCPAADRPPPRPSEPLSQLSAPRLERVVSSQYSL